MKKYLEVCDKCEREFEWSNEGDVWPGGKDRENITCPYCGNVTGSKITSGYIAIHTHQCRYCGSMLIPDEGGADRRGTIRYECSAADCYGVFFSENGGPIITSEERCRSAGPICDNCGRSLRGGSFTPKWSEGNNPDDSIKCPHCRHINYLWE